MFQEIFISPVLFIESIIGCLVLPKLSIINPVYGNAVSGGVLTGLSTIGIIPHIDSFLGHIVVLSTLFVLFCIQHSIDLHNSRKTISLWTNCVGMSCYGLISGLSLSLTSGYEFIKYAVSLIVCTLTISYAIGYRYIEYITKSNDRIPLLMYTLSTPLGLVIGRYSGLSYVSSDLLLGVSAGTFLSFGINSMLSHTKSVSAIYLDKEIKEHNNILLCFSVLCGFVLSAILQSHIFIDIINSINKEDSNELLLNNTNSSILLNNTNSTL